MSRSNNSPPGMRPVSHDANVARQNKNANGAEEFIREHAKASWLAVNGEVLREAELGAEKSHEDAEKAQDRLRKAREKRDDTDEYLNMARHRDGDGSAPAGRDTPLSDWNWYDKVIVFGSGTAMALMVLLGAANVAVTILGSGIPAFLDNPVFAWMLGGIVPAAAMAVKSGYHLFDHDASRRRYAFVVFGAAGVLFALWIVFFTFSFKGPAAEVDWGAIASGEPISGGDNRVGTLRNIVQILGEIVIGASLFLVIDRVQATYSSAYIVKNPKWVEAEKRVQELEAPAAETLRRRQTDEARVVQMRAALDVYVGEALSILRDMQSGKRV